MTISLSYRTTLLIAIIIVWAYTQKKNIEDIRLFSSGGTTSIQQQQQQQKTSTTSSSSFDGSSSATEDAAGIDINNNNNKINNNNNIDDDWSWLNHIQIGLKLGTGAYTDAFDVTFDAPKLNFDDQSSNKKKHWVIKFTGDNNGKNKDYASSSKLAKDISDRLTPHPNIPTTLYFIESMPNPFLKRNNNTSGVYLNLLDLPNRTDFSNHSRNRLGKSIQVSISVEEKIIPTQDHGYTKSSGTFLKVPSGQIIACYWQRIFETLNYLHSKQVSLEDTQLWNFFIRNNHIVVFDFNLAKIYYNDDDDDSSNNTVHEDDTQSIGRRIKQYLDDQDWLQKEIKKLEDKKGNSKTATITKLEFYKSLIISKEDYELLRNLSNMMRMAKHNNKSTPTMGWLLNNHEYFQKYRNESCILSW